MSKDRTPHVVSHDGRYGFFGFECKHCGERQKMATPIAIDVYIAAGKAFLKLHKTCKAPQVPATEAEAA